jgi:MFS family permease
MAEPVFQPPVEPAPTPTQGKIGILRPLRVRDFRLLWTGMSVSYTGDGIYLVAIAWEVYRLSNVPSALAWVGFSVSLPTILLMLFSGVWSDRFERRRLLVIADTVRGVAIGTMGVLTVTGVVRLWHLVALSVVYGVGQAVFGPAFNSILPDLVPRNLLVEANSLTQFMRPFALALLGPALGGFVANWIGPGPAFLVDAGTFAWSASAILRMTHKPPVRRPEDKPSTRAEMREGLRYVLSHQWLWGGMLSATIGLLATWGPFEVLVPYIVKNRLHGNASDLGLVFAAGGVASVLTAFALGQLGLPKRFMTFMYLSWSVASFSLVGFAFAHALWQAAASAAIESAGISALLVAWYTAVQHRVPGSLLGRVSSLDWMISASLVPLSFALTGPVAGALGARTTLLGAGLIGGSTILLTIFALPGVLEPERQPAEAGEATG